MWWMPSPAPLCLCVEFRRNLTHWGSDFSGIQHPIPSEGLTVLISDGSRHRSYTVTNTDKIVLLEIDDVER